MLFENRNFSWRVENTKTLLRKCQFCNNTAEQFVSAQIRGVSLGIIFTPPQTRLGIRDYYLTCPICNKYTKQISKNELECLKQE